MIGLKDIQGHWQRRWIKAPGFEDDTTRVHWMQVGPVYADVRIPIERPSLDGAACIAELSGQAIQALTNAEGFAGTVRVENCVCTWARHINWHGETRDIDAGRLSWDETGDLIETGVHAHYTELWTRPSDSTHSGLKLAGDGLTGFLVSVGEAFVFGLGQPDAPAFALGGAVAPLFDGVHLFGRWEGDTGIATLSTNPFQEGNACLTRAEQGVIYSHVDFRGNVRVINLGVVAR